MQPLPVVEYLNVMEDMSQSLQQQLHVMHVAR